MNRNLYFEISKSSTSAYSSINPTSPPSSLSPLILRFHHPPIPPYHPHSHQPTNLTLYTKTNPTRNTTHPTPSTSNQRNRIQGSNNNTEPSAPTTHMLEDGAI